MRRYFLLFMIIISLSLSALGQTEKNKLYIGVAPGITINKLYSSTGYRKDTNYKNESGFSFAIPLRYEFFHWLAVQADPGLISKNYKIVHNAYLDGNTYNIYNNAFINKYLQLPVMAHLSIGGQKLRIFLNAGGFIGYQVGARLEGVNIIIAYYRYDEKYEFDSRKDNRFEYGILGGLGVKYNTKSWTLFAEGRFHYGLSDLQKDYMLHQIPRYNNTFLIQAGILFNFFKSK
ncbi:MAG: PorT family protein [Bacteroidales bacterium]|jgi:hypothetical protein|nr:PorT family protein [Bacteroidales bacterium]